MVGAQARPVGSVEGETQSGMLLSSTFFSCDLVEGVGVWFLGFAFWE